MRGLCAWICVAVGAVMAQGQPYRGEAVPVASRTEPVELVRVRLLTFVFGREGPMDAPLRSAPVAGREYFLEADLSGMESAAAVRFEVIDLAGRTLVRPVMWKATDSSGDGEFYGALTVPQQPFRFAVSGTGVNGAAFRRVLNDVFQPVANGPQEAVAPQVAAYAREMQARKRRAAAAHPDGLIVIERAVVSRMGYEPTVNTSGAVTGLRLRYSIRFAKESTVVAIPSVFPVYANTDWRGLVEMKPLTGSITPAPRLAGVTTLQESIQYRAAATYSAGVTYTFVVDVVPNYIFQGTLSGRYCIYEESFATNRARWDALRASTAAVAYSVSIPDTETYLNVPQFYPQRTFYETYVAGGAGFCSAGANVRF